jgi:NAD(P)-dependent dehydrogenase (short-subunit alcohol dehydrogenase family)
MTTILITGANRGIGLEFVKQYAGDANIIACCREPAKADALKAVKGNIRIMALEVTDAASVAALARDLKGEAIDILINNAGIGGPRDAKPNTLDVDAWLNVFKVNTIAPMLVAFGLRENLLKGKDKKLVTITSLLGSTANNAGDMQPYRASKAAVNNLMHGLSKEWAGDGILVGIFHPGWVQTDMGGKSAPVVVQDSVRGLRARIAELNAKNSGTYRDFQNTEIAW